MKKLGRGGGVMSKAAVLTLAGLTVLLTGGIAASAAPTSPGDTGGDSGSMAGATSLAGLVPSLGRHVFNVRDYGALGDGVANDSPAADAAIVAANAAGGGIVEFPAGTYLAGGTIHLLSNVIIKVDTGATVTGAATGYDVPEPNDNSAFQDFGHSHFHDAMFWGDGLRNIGFIGGGVIDGGGRFITGNPKNGQADKLISLTRCDGLVVGNGLTLRRGGHFAMLINGCNHVLSDHLTIDTANDRDGWNIISTRNVLISNANIAANDDALVFKSDWALGATLPNGNVIVYNANLSAKCCNALMFGSETCGDFTNYWFSNITITGAGKSGLGLVSMDGANISNVNYNDITLSGTASPITEKIGTRKRCGGTPGVGSIKDIHYHHITGTNAGSFSPTLWGQPDHQIRDVSFEDVHLTLPGGRAAMDPNVVPSDNGDYNPNSLSTRPAYGFYLHNVQQVSFEDSSFALAADDGRPAFIANAGSDISLRNVTAQRGTTSPFDVGFQSIAGYCLSRGQATPSGPLRISTPDSTSGCRSNLDVFDLAAQPASQSGAVGRPVTYTVHTSVVSGRPDAVTLAVTGLPAGAHATFTPATVQPGQDARLTIVAAPRTRNASYPLTVVGTDSTATQYARAALTVTGGIDLTITGLSVADPDNAADWSVRSNLQPGATLFGDRVFTVASVPNDLVGAQWIRTANDSRTVTTNPLVTFAIGAPATIAVAVDTRLGRPAWIDSTWADSGNQLTDWEGDTTFRRFEVFTKPYGVGTVTLGPAAAGTASSDMYAIAVL